jgi:hypothetical protein
MSSSTNIHPDVVRDALLADTKHPVKRRNIELIHRVCKERDSLQSRDFTLASIGEFVENRSGPKAKTLWNQQSADYRKLIDAWQAYAGGPKLKEAAKAGGGDALTRSIADPAARIVVEKLIRERNALRAECNILKSQTKLVIDKRPVASAKSGTGVTADGSMTLEVRTGPSLNALEREALEHAISPEMWRAEGWKEDKNGRVIKDLGEGRSRTVFKPGFISAVRKLLQAN